MKPGAGSFGPVAYGVDPSRDGVRLVRVERRSRKWVTQPIDPADARFAADVARGVPVAAALGPRESITHWLQVAMDSPAKARRVLPTVLDIEIPFQLEDCSHCFLSVQRAAAGGVRALGVAARHQDVTARLARLEAIGIEAAVLDHEGLALWSQSLAESPADAPDSTRAVLRLEDEHATLVIGVGEDYRGTHRVRIDALESLRRIVRAAVGDETSRVRWWLVGAGAEAGDIRDAVRARLSETFGGVVKVHREPTLFLARALALRVVMPGAWGVNLRMGGFAHPALLGRSTAAVRHALVAALVAGVVLCGVNAAGHVALARRVVEQQAAAAAAGRAAAGAALGAARGEQAILIARRQSETREERLAPYRRMVEPSVTQGIREVLETAQLGGLELASVTWRPGAVGLAGQGRAWESAEPLLSTLERHGYRGRLDRGNVPADAGSAVTFSIQAEVGHD